MRWDIGLNQKHIAYFVFPRQDIKIMPGDELRLCYQGDLRPHWNGLSRVIKVPNATGDEVGLELIISSKVPLECTHNFAIEFVWKSITFDR